jgi:hypothetical protein
VPTGCGLLVPFPLNLQSASCESVRQFDSFGVLFVALVLLSKNLFEPMCLFLSEPLIGERGMMNDEELLAAAITPEHSHFLETRRFLLAQTILYCDCPHNSTSPIQGPSVLFARIVANLWEPLTSDHSNSYTIFRLSKSRGIIRESSPTDPNHIAGFKAQNGAGTKSEMGKGSEGVTAGSDDSENNGLGSRKAHHVNGSPQEDRSISAGKVGQIKSSTEEGCLVGLLRIPALAGANKESVPRLKESRTLSRTALPQNCSTKQ